LRTAYVELLLPPADCERAVQRCISLYHGCAWRGSVLRVERAVEHYSARLKREWAAAAAAAEARSLAAAEATVAAAEREAGAEAAIAAAAVRLAEETMLIRSRDTSKLLKVHACGGRYAGRHKRSFQRLAQPPPLSAAELAAAVTPAAPKAPAMPAPAARPLAAAPAASDPWAAMFRRAAGVEEVADVSDADELPFEPQPTPLAVEHATPVPLLEPPPPVASTAPPEPVPKRAAMARLAEPPRKRVERPPSPSPAATVTGEALAAERAAQLGLLARLGFMEEAKEVPVLPPPIEGDRAEEEAPLREASPPLVQQAVLPPATAPSTRAARRAAAAAASPVVPLSAVDAVETEAAWQRVLRLAGESMAAEPSAPPAAEGPAVARASRAVRRAADRSPAALQAAPDAAGGAEEDVPAPAATKSAASRAGVLAALARTRLGEGRQGVYFADGAFPWRDLALRPEAQTWSLLGAAEATKGKAEVVPPATEEPTAPLPLLPLPLALSPTPPLDLSGLGASFVRTAGMAAESDRSALLDTAKRNRRAALKGRR